MTLPSGPPPRHTSLKGLSLLARGQLGPGVAVGKQWLPAATARRVGAWLYLVVVGAGLVLTAAQVLVLPRLLGAVGFGIAAIAISVTQGFFGFGDLGLGRLSDDTSLPHEERARLRTLSFAVASMLLVAMAVLGGTLALLTRSVLIVSCLLAAATAWCLCRTQLRAQAHEAEGDEVGGSILHFVWQNAPKVGLLAGAAVARTPVGSMMGGLLVAAVVSPPRPVSLRVGLEVLGLWRRWLPAFLSVAAPFVIGWSDMYFVAAHNGLAAAAGYAIVYRVLGGVSYLYLPFGSILLSRLNRGEGRAAWAVPLASLAITIPSLLVLWVGLVKVGSTAFPNVHLELDVVAPLVLMYAAANLSYLVGTTLAARGRFRAILAANVIGAVVALTGHALFTLRMSVVAAALVSMTATLATAALQAVFAWRSFSTTGGGQRSQALDENSV